MKTSASIILLLVFVTGCSQLDRIGNKIYTPVTSTNLVETPSGTYPVVSTNGWVLNPTLESGIQLAGDVAPFPWAGLASNALVAVLGIGAAIRGRQWKKAAVSGVSAAETFKRELKQLDAAKAQSAKDNVVREQRSNGTQALVKKILNQIV
jgi:hypothetical protein